MTFGATPTWNCWICFTSWHSLWGMALFVLLTFIWFAEIMGTLSRYVTGYLSEEWFFSTYDSSRNQKLVPPQSFAEAYRTRSRILKNRDFIRFKWFYFFKNIFDNLSDFWFCLLCSFDRASPELDWMCQGLRCSIVGAPFASVLSPTWRWNPFAWFCGSSCCWPRVVVFVRRSEDSTSRC